MTIKLTEIEREMLAGLHFCTPSDPDEVCFKSEESERVVVEIIAAHCAKAWDNGVDTAGQYCERPWVVDDECKPLNPYREDA